jgi:hypothetical protein
MNARGDIIRSGVPGTAIQVGTDHRIAMARQTPRELLVELVPARQVVDRDDPWERSVAFRSRDVGVDQSTVTSTIRRDAANKSLLGVRLKRVPHIVQMLHRKVRSG